jgi:hypothetical protein
VEGRVQVPRHDRAAEARERPRKRQSSKLRSVAPRRIWRDTLPIRGTLAEHYLRGRGITAELPTRRERFAPRALARRDEAAPARPGGARGGRPRLRSAPDLLRPDGSGKADVKPARSRSDRSAAALCASLSPASPLWWWPRHRDGP